LLSSEEMNVIFDVMRLSACDARDLAGDIDDRSEAKNSAGPAMSSGVPILPRTSFFAGR
jgi:hypothetical protein